jgi:hypothetical protein
MLDAGAAVQLAAVGVLPRITLSPANPLVGQTLTLGGGTSLVGAGRSIASYLWVIANTGGIVTSFTGATDGAIVTITPTAAGQFSVSLRVIDDLGAQATSTSSIVVSAQPNTGSTGGSSGGGALGASWLIVLLVAVLALARRRA